MSAFDDDEGWFTGTGRAGERRLRNMAARNRSRPGNEPIRPDLAAAPSTEPPGMGGKVPGMTETSESPRVITGPDIHPAGHHAETVGYGLPFGGHLVLRVEQDKRRTGRFRCSLGQRQVDGTRDEVLREIDAHVLHLAEREVRRREGSTDPRDHAVPPSNLDARALWLHLCECYVAWHALGEGRGRMLPDESRRMANASNLLGTLPWIEGERLLRPDRTDEHYRTAYRLFQGAWSDAADTWRYQRDADELWKRTR